MTVTPAYTRWTRAIFACGVPSQVAAVERQIGSATSGQVLEACVSLSARGA